MNKTFLTVSQVFAIITAIGVFIGSVVTIMIAVLLPTINDESLAPLTESELSTVQTILWIIAIVFIVIGIFNIIATKKMAEGKSGKASPEVVRIFAIILIFTAGLLAGIFGILGTINNDQNQVFPLEEQLKELNSLLERNIITQDEYDKRRAELVKKA